ncbi:hydroxypyruvate isomerase family protein [Ornithinimicrobium faecis]|uniref:hydroxypyruvate isomerase family protein n=1 Tax=Ornithinimicrobium faecis TaxID=2934158 RepID=UPI0021191AB5|nr:TIM barrel protein [Ornithinimicrobium sp. HY1745]
MYDSLRWVANLSLLFTEQPLLERPAAARAAGFEEVEFWWPFGTSGRPDRAEIDAFVVAVQDAGATLTAMNLFAGDMPAGERGVLSYPERTAEFRDSVDIAMEVGERLGVRMFNAPYGHRRDGLDPTRQDEIADESLAYAATAAARIDGVIMFEPVSGMPQYPMKRSADALQIIDRVTANTGVTNLGFLLDQFHLAMNGEDPVQVARDHASRVHHVQIADTPGRGEPGSGDADVIGMVDALRDGGYEGAFALEFIPAVSTAESLKAWHRQLATWTP